MINKPIQRSSTETTTTTRNNVHPTVDGYR